MCQVVGKKFVSLFGSRFACISRARRVVWGKVSLDFKYTG